MIEIKKLSFGYANSTPLFEDLSFTVGDGEQLFLKGDSGRGKTTLLYCLCGIIPRNIAGRLSGSVEIDGKPVAELSNAELPQAVAMVFQEPGSRIFLPSVEDELAFTLENLCVPPEDMRERIAHALELTSLTSKRHTNPAELSGGQIKLLAFAAVLAMPPRVLLFDEITAGLDAAAVDRLKLGLDRLKSNGTAIIISEHHTGIWGERGKHSELRI